VVDVSEDDSAVVAVRVQRCGALQVDVLVGSTVDEEDGTGITRANEAPATQLTMWRGGASLGEWRFSEMLKRHLADSRLSRLP